MKSTERFGERAQAYAAFRPSYPPEAVGAVLEGLGDPHGLTIADVGAGTGISAHLFAERGAHVIAIEPNERMRGQARAHSKVTWREGTGERTGLPDASVDAIVACQAFHWFATPAAVTEFRRVARRRAALLQNEGDERDAFTRAYGDLVRAHATDDTETLRKNALSIFATFPDAAVRRARYSSSYVLSRKRLLGRASSVSYLPASGPAMESLHADLHALFDRWSRDDSVKLCLVTYVVIADW